MFARREAKTRIRQRDWLKLAGEKIRREQVRTVPTFLCVRAYRMRTVCAVSYAHRMRIMRVSYHINTRRMSRRIIMNTRIDQFRIQYTRMIRITVKDRLSYFFNRLDIVSGRSPIILLMYFF